MCFIYRVMLQRRTKVMDHAACARFQLTVYSTVALISNFADLDLDDLEEEEDEDDGEIFSERFPDAPIYNDSFQKVLGETRDQLRELHEILRTCSLTSDPRSALRSLSNQTKKLSEYQYPKNRVVGLVGESGVGELSQTTLLRTHISRQKQLDKQSSSPKWCCSFGQYIQIVFQPQSDG
jgi:hypothetical protein